MNTPPERMEPVAIVQEIGSLGRELQARLQRIQVLSQGLHQRVRRSPADDNTAPLIKYANMWARFAGMGTQGLKRAASADRFVRGLTPPEAEHLVKRPIQQAVEPTTPVESLLDMYGEDSDVADEVIQSVIDDDDESE